MKKKMKIILVKIIFLFINNASICPGDGHPLVMHLPYLLVVVILCNVLVARPIGTNVTAHRKNGSLWRSMLDGMLPISLR